MENAGPLAADTSCSTCAFSESGAGTEIYNRLRARIAVLGAIPFFCHHTRSGPEYEWRAPASIGPLQLHPSERRVCAAWKAAVAEQYRRGGPFEMIRGGDPDTVALRRYQHQLGSIAMAQLEDFILLHEPAAREAALKELASLIAVLQPSEERDGK